jgi:hypothetical protein
VLLTAILAPGPLLNLPWEHHKIEYNDYDLVRLVLSGSTGWTDNIINND